MTADEPASLDPGLARLLAESRLIVVCGPGGVGKTTIAAALGVVAARDSATRVLVLTVDPARRLATALGLEALGNVEVPVRVDGARGTLTMAMIDTKASWDDMIRHHAPDPTTRDRVLANDLYKTLTSRFVHSHDYVVTERLYEAREGGAYDLVIVDTPPSRSALSILDAPGRMEQFFGSRLLRLLTAPAQSRLLTLASRPFFIVADRILGAAFLSDIAEFFGLFRTMEGPIVERARRVGALLGEPETSYIVVTAAEPVAVNESEYLVGELRRRRRGLRGVLVNRLLPASIAAGSNDRAASFEALSDPARRSLAVAEREIATVARRQAAMLGRIRSLGTALLLSEARGGEITDVEALYGLGAAVRSG